MNPGRNSRIPFLLQRGQFGVEAIHRRGNAFQIQIVLCVGRAAKFGQGFGFSFRAFDPVFQAIKFGEGVIIDISRFEIQ